MIFTDLINEITRYKPGWYSSLQISDLSTWLTNFHADNLVPIYTICLAEKAVTQNLERLSRASKIANAAYVAMSGEQAKSVTFDPYFEVMLSLAIEERRGQAEE